MTNCRVEKKVHGETLASRGNISSNSRKQYANGEVGVRARRTDATDATDSTGLGCHIVGMRWYIPMSAMERNAECKKRKKGRAKRKR